MATLTETDVWEDGIYQLEQDDLVQGGADGIDNVQARQLANRTAYLKALVEALGTGKQDAAVTLAALATLVGSADKLAYFTGANTAELTTFTAFARTLIAAADAGAVRTAIGAVTKTDIDTALAALVNASPATLDTLNELATALGNDPNFATTITHALAAKAPLASPALTGTPTAPTPAQFGSDLSLTNCEFVQRALGNLSGYAILSASTTVLAASAGKHILISGTSAAVTMSLPSASALPVLGGASFHFFNASLYSVTVKCYGSELIQVVSAAVSSIILLPGDTLSIEAIAGTIWEPISGSALLKYSGGFASSLATNGYQKLPSGRIRQWGYATVTAAATSQVVTLPLTYPAAHLWNAGSSASISSYGGSSGTDLATISVWGSNAGAAIAWESIGR